MTRLETKHRIPAIFLFLCMFFIVSWFGNSLSVFADEAEDEPAAVDSGSGTARVEETGESYPTLQEAIDAVGENGTITLLSGTTENISSNKSYTLNMNGCTINGGQAGSVYTISGGTVTLKNGTLTNGNAGNGGGISSSGANLTLEGMTITGNTASYNGGGIYFRSGTFTLRSSVILNNKADGYGGGAYVGNSAILESTRFEGNSSKSGGAALYISCSGTVSVSRCDFTGNYYNGSSVTSSIIAADEVMGNGADFVFENCNITNNHSVEYTFYVESENYYWGEQPVRLTLNSCVISDNEAVRGGGIFIYDYGNVTLNDTVIKNNKVTGTPGSNTPVAGGVVCKNSVDITFNFNSGAIYNNTSDNGAANDLYIGTYATVNTIAASAMSDTGMDFSNYYVWNKPDGRFIVNEMSGRYANQNGYSDGLSLTAFDASTVPAAMYNGQKYESILEAIGAATNDNANPAYIKLLPRENKDGSMKKSFAIDKVVIDIPVVLDMNECILTAKDGLLYEIAENVSFTLSGKGGLEGQIDVKKGGSLILAAEIESNFSIDLEDETSAIKLSDDFVSCGKLSITLDETLTNALNSFNGSGADISIDIISNVKDNNTVDVELKNITNLRVIFRVEKTNENEKGVLKAVNPKLNGVFVGGDGCNDERNDGTLDSSFETIEKALETLKNDEDAGDTIYVIDTISIDSSEPVVWDGGTDKKVYIKRWTDPKDPNGQNLNGAIMIDITKGSLELKNIIVDGGSEDNYKNAGSMINVSSIGTLILSEKARLQNNDIIGSYDSETFTAKKNIAHFSGGAVYTEGGTIKIEKDSIIDNCSAILGGGIYCKNGTIEMRGGTVKNCSAEKSYTVSTNGSENIAYQASGGGIAITGNNAKMTMYGGTFQKNKATCGGGVAVGMGGYDEYRGRKTNVSFEMISIEDRDESLVMRLALSDDDESEAGGNRFIGNIATDNGGGLFIQSSYKAVVNEGTFEHNECYGGGYGNFGGGAIYVNGGKEDANHNRVHDGELWLKNVLIMDNNAKYFGGGIAGCSTSGTIVERAEGSVIYHNYAYNTADNQLISTGTIEKSLSDISTATDPYQVGKFDGPKHGETNDHFIQYMMDGTPYFWQSAIDKNGFEKDEYVSEDYLNSDTGKAVYTSAEPMPGTVGNMIKVKITNNTSGSNGGGIGSNGSVFIGLNYQPSIDYQASEDYDQPADKFEVQKNWDIYPSNLAQFNIWLATIDEDGIVNMIHNPMIIGGKWEGKVGFEHLNDGKFVLLEEAVYTDGLHVWAADGSQGWSENAEKYKNAVKKVMTRTDNTIKDYIWSDDARSPFISNFDETDYIFTNTRVNNPSNPLFPVKISKIDVTDGAALPGANLVIKNSAGTVIYSWTSDGTINDFQLVPGTYTIEETAAPSGYERIIGAVRFTVGADGTITVDVHSNAEKSDTGVVLVKNKAKQAIADQNPLAQPNEPVMRPMDASADASSGDKAEDFSVGSGSGLYRETEIGNSVVTTIAVIAPVSIAAAVLFVSTLRRRKK